MPPLEIDAVAHVEQLRARLLEREHLVERQGPECVLHRHFKALPLLAVEDRIVDEVVGSLGLVGGDDLLERLPAHRLEGVVEDFLLADRGDGLL